jgi:hypothetical protein
MKGNHPMAIIPQPHLFSWENVDAESDLRRLELVLQALPDEKLMQKLEFGRGGGRNDYPVRAVWNSLIAAVVFEHEKAESLRRELMRNGELRQVCGFDPHLGSAAVPTPRAYTNFLKALFKCTDEIEAMFDQLVQQLTQLLPDFGKCLAVDSKAISSFSRGKSKHTKSDGRRDLDADWGRKEYKGVREDGTLWKKLTKWFGYKLHLVVDSTYELPVALDLTRASKSDQKHLLPLMEKIKQTHPDLIERAEHLSADRGYDSEKHNRALYDDFGIKPIIAIRHMWKDPDHTRPLFPERVDNIVYDKDGTIFCVCPKTSEHHQMAYSGFEKDRDTLKYRCPATAYGIECKGLKLCSKSVSKYGRVVRVSLSLDRRLFVPVARSSYKWRHEYKKRTGVERVNSRLDVSFGFEKHTTRGMKKMRLKVGLALVVMLALAVGAIESGGKEKMRSLVDCLPKQAVA